MSRVFKPTVNQEEVIAEQAVRGNRVVVRCEVLGRGMEWLGFGPNLEKAFDNLEKNVRSYIAKYYQ